MDYYGGIMRKVINESVDDIDTVLDFVLMALNNPKNPEVGARYDEILATVPVIKKVTAALKDDHVLLEEAEFNLVSEKVKLLPFKVITEKIAEMIQKVIDSEDVKVSED